MISCSFSVDGVTELSELRVTELGTQFFRVSGRLSIFHNPFLTEVSIRARDSIELVENPVLERAEFDFFAAFDGHHAPEIHVAGNPALERFSPPGLTSANRIFIGENPALTELDLSILLSAQRVDIVDNTALPVCQITALFDRIACLRENQSGNDETGSCLTVERVGSFYKVTQR